MISLKENSETQSIYINVGKKEVNFYSMFPGRLVARECKKRSVSKSLSQKVIRELLFHINVYIFICAN